MQQLGQYLVRERTLREITIEQVALSTRIPKSRLLALEEGTIEAGYAPYFTRAYALAIGISPKDALLLLAEQEPDAEADKGKGRGSRALTWTLLALLFAAGGAAAAWRFLM